MTDPSQRVSDADRDRAIVALREHAADGRLTLEEFTDRVGAALAARTRGDLAALAVDLPPAAGAPAATGRSTKVTGAAFGHVVRRGRMRLQRRSTAVAAFADLDLDLRDATVDGPTTVVTTVVGFGNVDVYVPDGVNVEVTGLTVFGHRRQWGFDAGRPDAPTVHVRVVGLFATVDVWSVPREVTGDYGEVFRAVQQLHRTGQRALPP
jgi:hypothetical protein